MKKYVLVFALMAVSPFARAQSQNVSYNCFLKVSELSGGHSVTTPMPSFASFANFGTLGFSAEPTEALGYTWTAAARLDGSTTLLTRQREGRSISYPTVWRDGNITAKGKTALNSEISARSAPGFAVLSGEGSWDELVIAELRVPQGSETIVGTIRCIWEPSK